MASQRAGLALTLRAIKAGGCLLPDPSMTATKTDLPSFRHPPVGEVVLALQFENLDKLDVRHAGALTERFHTRLPRFVAQAPLDPIFERFGEFRAAPNLSVQMVDLPLFPRLWLIDEKEAELVQIQRDRLMHNWRRMSDSEEYPRYSQLRKAFLHDWTTMSAFVGELGLGTLLPTQCEVSYVNHIDVGPLENGYPDPSTIFSFLSPTLATHGEAAFEAATFSSSSIAKAVTSKGQEMAGRMYVELISGTNARSKRRIYQLNLTLRGAPPARDIDGVLEFFDFARERIVRGFCALTTPEMHKQWGREA